MSESKVYTNSERAYRNSYLRGEDEYTINLIVYETDVLITLPQEFDEEKSKQIALNSILKSRQEIMAYIALYPEFRTSLLPIKRDKKTFPIVQEMLEASQKIGVGPFACVAGAIAECTARTLCEEMKKVKCKHNNVIVENGGDVYIISDRKRTVGIVHNPEEEQKLGMSLKPTKGLALCASSSKIGHSLSFGNADIVMTQGKNASLADAAATAYANMLKSKNDIPRVIERAKKDEKNGISAVFMKCEGNLAAYGDIELVLLS